MRGHSEAQKHKNCEKIHSDSSVFDAFAAMPTANPLNEIPLEAYDPSRASVQLSDTPFGAQQFNMTMNCPGMETIQRGYVICNSSTQIMPSKGNLIILQ